MPKILLVIFIALSPAFLSLIARADDDVHQCAKPEIDPRFGQYFVDKNDTVIEPYLHGYKDLNSTDDAGVIGGGGRACNNGERAYVCDWEATVYCTRGVTPPDTVDHWTKGAARKGEYVEKGRDDRKDVLRSCQFAGAGGFNHEPLKNEVAIDGEPAKCGFASGSFRYPCSFIKVYHNVTSIGEIKKHQEEIIAKENAHGFQDACRSAKNEDPRLKPDERNKNRPPESVRSIIADYENEGTYWRNKNQWPQVYGAPLPLPAAPVVIQPPPPPPTPVAGPCDDITAQSPCDRWRDCKGQVPPPHMQICKCSVSECSKVLEYVANRFSNLSSGAATPAFMQNNEIKKRADAAIDAIDKFRNDVDANRSGTYYQNDFDHCVFARFAALSDNPNSSSTCHVTSTTPSLGKLEQDLKRLKNPNESLSGLDLDSMKEELTALDDFAANYDTKVGKITTEGVLEKLPRSAYADAKTMLQSLYDLSIHDGEVRFSDLATNSLNAKYFLNRAEKRTDDASGLGIRKEVGSYYAGFNHGDQCIQVPSSTDTTTMNNFLTAFKNDLSWEQKYAQIEIRCNGDGNNYPAAGSSKLMRGKPNMQPSHQPNPPYTPPPSGPVTGEGLN